MDQIIQPGSAWDRIWRSLSLIVVAVVFTLLAVRQHSFVQRYSVNLMFGDQWDFYTSLQKPSVWGLFDRQHGLHRQGVGFLLTWALASYSHWNSCWDAYGVSFVLIAAAGLGIILAWRCGVPQPLALVAVPLLYLTLRQWEGFLCASNISCGAMPIFLFTAYCLAWFIRNDYFRFASLTLLNFCLVFTGYGLFVGLITPIIFAVEALQAWAIGESGRARLASLALLAAGFSWWMFSWNYLWVPADDFRFPFERPIEYFYFLGTMLSNFYGVAGIAWFKVPFGLFVSVCLLGLCAVHGWNMLRAGVANQRRSAVIFSLAAYTLIYCCLTAIGRVCLGWQIQALASRYVTLMIPGGMAIFLHLTAVESRRAATAVCLLYALAILLPSTSLSDSEWKNAQDFHDARLAWKVVYLATHDEELADRRAQLVLYPQPAAILGRLHYLEEHHLNLYYQPDQPPLSLAKHPTHEDNRSSG